MSRIFVSHAVKDKKLVDDFIDLLEVGVNIEPDDIFCTSLEGMGIPSGHYFVDYIKRKLQRPEVVLLLISESYLASPFCTQEVGAAWALSLPIHPLLIPPVGYDDLKAVLAGVQARKIDSKTDLNELRDDLVEKLGLKPLRTSRWEAKRDKFLGRLGDILSHSPRPALPVPAPGGGAAFRVAKKTQGNLPKGNAQLHEVVVVGQQSHTITVKIKQDYIWAFLTLHVDGGLLYEKSMLGNIGSGTVSFSIEGKPFRFRHNNSAAFWSMAVLADGETIMSV